MWRHCTPCVWGQPSPREAVSWACFAWRGCGSNKEPSSGCQVFSNIIIERTSHLCPLPSLPFPLKVKFWGPGEVGFGKEC